MFFLIPRKPKLTSDAINLLVPETTKQIQKHDSRILATSKMKLGAYVINCLKAVDHKTREENVSISLIKIIASCIAVFYFCPGVATRN